MMNDPALTTDAALLRLYAKDRDPEAFAELIRRHAGLVYGTCKRVLGNEDDAQDVSQECFLELARKAGSVRSSLPAYLHHLARNRSVDAIRKASARRRKEEEAAMLTDNSSEPTWADIAPLVDEALSRLPDRLRVPIILHYLEGRTQEQIAQELGVSQSTVSRNLDRGVSNLREALKKAGVIVSVGVLAGLLTENAATAAPGALVATLGKMAVSGVGATISAVGVSTLLASLLGTVAGKCVILLALCVSAAVGVSVVRGHENRVPIVGATDLLAVAKRGAAMSARDVRSGRGTVTIDEVGMSKEDGIYENTYKYRVVFSGVKYLCDSDYTILRNDAAGNERVVPAGTREVTRVSFDGKTVTVYKPKHGEFGDLARIGGLGRTECLTPHTEIVDNMPCTLGRAFGEGDLLEMWRRYSTGKGKVGKALIESQVSAPRKEVINGDECIVVEHVSKYTEAGKTTTAISDWWVDTAKGYTTTQCRMYLQSPTGKHVLMESVDVDLKNYGNDLWLPRSYTRQYYLRNASGGSDPAGKKTVTYDPQFEINVPVDDVELSNKLPSGTGVTDERNKTTYIVP